MPYLSEGYPFEVSEWGALLYERLEPLAYADGDNGWALLALLDSIGRQYQELDDLISPDGDEAPWSKLLDVERCPVAQLPWLAQLVGVRIPSGLTEAAAREMVRHPAGWSRGTPGSMIRAAQATLTGNKTVVLLERQGDPYNLTVVTRTAETPNAAATLKALQAVKPVGILMTHTVVAGKVVEELAGSVNALTGTVDSLG